MGHGGGRGRPRHHRIHAGGDTARPCRATEDVLSQFRALGDRYSEGIALQTLGTIARAQGDLAESTHRFDEALAIARESGDGRGQVPASAIWPYRRDSEASSSKQPPSIEKDSGWPTASAPRKASSAAWPGLAVSPLSDEFEHAARLLGTTAALIDRLGAPLQPAEQTQFDHDVAAIRSALPEDAFSRAWSCSRSLTPDVAVAQVLEEAQADATSPNHGLVIASSMCCGLLVKGMTDREIAAALFISPGTAMTHVKRIRGKLGVHCGGAAVAFAVRHGLA